MSELTLRNNFQVEGEDASTRGHPMRGSGVEEGGASLQGPVCSLVVFGRLLRGEPSNLLHSRVGFLII